MTTKSRNFMLVITLLIGLVLLLSIPVSCVSRSKPIEPSKVSPAQQETPSSLDKPIPQDMSTENTIRLTNGEWPPYLSEHLEYYGTASRIVSEAFALEGIEVEYGFFPWKRALELARSGEWDGSVVWLRTPDRERDYYFSDPVVQSNYVFWHLKSFNFDWQNIEDLQGVTVGGTRGYFYEEIFNRLEEEGKIKVEWVSDDDQNFMKLLAGRIDLFAQDVDVGKATLQSKFTAEKMALLTYHPRILRTDDMRLILSRQVEENERLIGIFNKGLQCLRDSGKLDSYLDEALEIAK